MHTGCVLQVKVTPKSRQNEILGFKEGVLSVKVASVPEKGKANESVIGLLAGRLGISKSRIQLISGATSRHKRFKIDGLTKETVESKL